MLCNIIVPCYVWITESPSLSINFLIPIIVPSYYQYNCISVMLLENWGIVQKMSLINSIINKHDVVTYNAGHFFGLKKKSKK